MFSVGKNWTLSICRISVEPQDKEIVTPELVEGGLLEARSQHAIAHVEEPGQEDKVRPIIDANDLYSSRVFFIVKI